ncbi:MAG: sulfur carrier protein ThiS [Candidatus Stygibacter australis]|nr:sulfur carrier protein ThiS [Candidatus Stygibacter australis]
MNNAFYLNDRLEEWHPGMTIKDLIDKKNFIFKMLVVKIDNKLIKKTDYDKTLIPDKSSVQILHLMSGG